MLFRNKQGVAQNKVDIEQLKLICKELEEKSCHIDEHISEFKANLETTTINISLNNRIFTNTTEDRKWFSFAFSSCFSETDPFIVADDERIEELEKLIKEL